MNLTYRSNVMVEDLAPGECTVHRAADSNGKRWWLLWFYVRRDDDAVLEDFAVAIEPGGVPREDGPGGRSWGLTDSGGGVWQIAPSINVLGGPSRRVIQGPADGSIWHHTPSIVGVPAGERWQP